MFDVTAPLDQDALHAGRTFRTQLPDVDASKGEFFDHVPLHWEVEEFHCVDGSYNGVVALGDDNQWAISIAHDPLQNAVEVADPPGYAKHTFGRNSHGFGLAISGMVDATTSNFGPDALQMHELEFLCAAAAAVCNKYNIQAGDQRVVYTHAECAVWDSYPSERWDLGRLEPSDAPLTDQERFATGNLLRRRIHDYKVEYDKEFQLGSFYAAPTP